MDTLSTILNAVWVEGMNLFHKKCVRALVRALLLTLSVNLLKLARAAFSDVRPLSTVRRIERLLAMGIFNVTLLGRAIVNALPPPEEVHPYHGPHHMGAGQPCLQHPCPRDML